MAEAAEARPDLSTLKAGPLRSEVWVDGFVAFHLVFFFFLSVCEPISMQALVMLQVSPFLFSHGISREPWWQLEP